MLTLLQNISNCLIALVSLRIDLGEICSQLVIFERNVIRVLCVIKMIREFEKLWTLARRINVLIVYSIITCTLPGLVSSLQLEVERKATYLKAAVGETVAFNCQLDFPHDVIIPYVLHWNKEGQTVFSWYEGVLTAKDPYKGRVKLLPPESGYGRGSVNLSSIRESDGGWYECRVYFPNRSPTTRHNGTWFHLAVDGGNLISTPPINQTTMEGESAHFPCITKDRNSTVVWLKDGIPLPDLNQTITLRSFTDPEGSLTISPTAMGDLGEYTCEVTGKNDEKQRASAYLNVQYKAKVLYAPMEIYLPYGRPALLDCHFRANPPLTNLRWEKDGFLFDPYNVQGVFYRRNGSLYFNKVDETHGGHYTCTPFNDLGTEGPSPVMNVVVQRPPVFTIKPHDLYLRRRGDSVDMPCHAVDTDGKHKSTIVWYKKDGNPLPSGRTSISGGNLTIENIEEDDRGIYQCVAYNEADSISTESELMVENFAPRAPYNTSAESTRSSITVRWQSWFSKHKVEFYVWYRLVDSSDYKSIQVPTKETTEITIEKLLGGREYEVMVLCQDTHGEGMFSKAIKVKTQGSEEVDSPTHQYQRKSDEFIGPPRNLNVALTPEGCLVTWDPPTEDLENVDHYTLRWTQGTRTGTAETMDTFYLVQDLEEDETYHFQVFVTTKGDLQIESSKFLVHIPSYRKVRAVSLGIGIGFTFLVLAVLVGWFVRRHFLQKRLNQNTKDRESIST